MTVSENLWILRSEAREVNVILFLRVYEHSGTIWERDTAIALAMVVVDERKILARYVTQMGQTKVWPSVTQKTRGGPLRERILRANSHPQSAVDFDMDIRSASLVTRHTLGRELCASRGLFKHRGPSQDVSFSSELVVCRDA